MTAKLNFSIIVLLFLMTMIACDSKSKNSKNKETETEVSLLKNSNNYTLKEGLSILLSLIDSENNAGSININCKKCKVKFVKSINLGNYVDMNLQKVDGKILIIDVIHYKELPGPTNYAFIPFPERFRSKLGNKKGIILGNGTDECDYFSQIGLEGGGPNCPCYWVGRTCFRHFCDMCNFNDNIDAQDLFDFDALIIKYSLLNFEDFNPLLNKQIKYIQIDEIK